MSKSKKPRDENIVVTINLSNNNNLITCTDSNVEKKAKAIPNSKKNYRSNSEVVKKEEILNSSDVLLDCENTYLSDKNEENKEQYLSTQKTNRNNEAIKIYRKEEKNKNYPLKIKPIDKKDNQLLGLQQQYNSTNKQKFMSHDFLRKKGKQNV